MVPKQTQTLRVDVLTASPEWARLDNKEQTSTSHRAPARQNRSSLGGALHENLSRLLELSAITISP